MKYLFCATPICILCRIVWETQTWNENSSVWPPPFNEILFRKKTLASSLRHIMTTVAAMQKERYFMSPWSFLLQASQNLDLPPSPITHYRHLPLFTVNGASWAIVNPQAVTRLWWNRFSSLEDTLKPAFITKWLFAIYWTCVLDLIHTTGLLFRFWLSSFPHTLKLDRWTKTLFWTEFWIRADWLPFSCRWTNRYQASSASCFTTFLPFLDTLSFSPTDYWNSKTKKRTSQ